MECPEAGMVQTCPTLRQGKEDFVYHTDQSDTQKAYGPVTGAVSHLESPDLGARAQITRQAVVGAHPCQGFSHLSLSPALLTWGRPFLLPGSYALVRLPQGKVNPGVQGPHPPAPPGLQHRARHRVGAHGEERFSHRLIVKGWRDRSPSLRVRPQTGAHVTLSKAFRSEEHTSNSSHTLASRMPSSA